MSVNRLLVRQRLVLIGLSSTTCGAFPPYPSNGLSTVTCLRPLKAIYAGRSKPSSMSDGIFYRKAVQMNWLRNTSQSHEV